MALRGPRHPISSLVSSHNALKCISILPWYISTLRGRRLSGNSKTVYPVQFIQILRQRHTALCRGGLKLWMLVLNSCDVCNDSKWFNDTSALGLTFFRAAGRRRSKYMSSLLCSEPHFAISMPRARSALQRHRREGWMDGCSPTSSVQRGLWELHQYKQHILLMTASKEAKKPHLIC